MLTINEPQPRAESTTRMTLRVYNTLSKNKEVFEPIDAGKVGIYLCGPTVYKPSHIGHMVGPVIFDAIKRYLTYSGYQVTLVINITDVDDKLIAESTKRGMTMAALATEMTADYMNNLQAMGVDTVDHFPRATDNMGEIIRFTQTLIEKGFAYESNGDVYFNVAKDPGYGKLSKRDVANTIGEGGSTAERKQNAADFALWKTAKPGEPSWDSPWGQGRPGWHIECSAMSRGLLGETFDIHGGGLDLMFPHHENEIAQSECCHGKPMARFWMHNGLMQAADEVGKVGGRNTRDSSSAVGDQAAQEAGKMGKSKGASAFSELLKKHAAENIRFFLLSTHYRSPIDFSDERIQSIGVGLDRFYRYFKRYNRVTGQDFYNLTSGASRAAGEFDPGDNATLKQIADRRGRFLEAMDDDFNTGGATAELYEIMGILNKFVDDNKLEGPGTPPAEHLDTLKQGTATLRELAAVLGLFRKPVEAKATADDGLVSSLMQLLIEIRAESRAKKDFATADKVRKSLAALGITLEDRATGTEWTKA